MSAPQGIFVPGRDNAGFIDPKTLSTTPGGTLYGTTPGGTRIVYDRNALFMIRNSPLAKTPPSGLKLPVIPGVTAPVDANPPAVRKEDSPDNSPPKHQNDDGELFKME